MKGDYLDRSPQHLPYNVDDLLLQLSNPQTRSSPRTSLSTTPRRTSLTSTPTPAPSPAPNTFSTTTTTTSRSSATRGRRMTAGGVPPSYSLSTSSSSTSSSSATTSASATAAVSSYTHSDRRRESGGREGAGAGAGRVVGGAGGAALRTGGAASALERGLARDLDRCHIRPTSRSTAHLCSSSSSSSSSKLPPSCSIKTSQSSPSALSSSSTLTDGSTKTSSASSRRGNRLYRTRQEARKAREEERASARAADPDLRKGGSVDIEDPSLSVSDSNSHISRDFVSRASDASKTSTTSSLYSVQDLDVGQGFKHDPHLLNNNDKSSARARRIQKSATTPVLAYPERASFDYESTTPDLSDNEEKEKKVRKEKKESEEKEKEGGKKRRFGRKMLAKTLRRSQSASCARDVPAHALFLRHHLGQKGVDSLEERLARGAAYSPDGPGEGEGEWGRGDSDTRRSSLPRSIHKTTSADAAMMSRDEFGNVTSQNKSNKKSLAKTMKRKLQFLRRRHTDSTLADMTKGDGKHSAAVDSDEALQWSRSFESLLTDKKGLELFRGFLRSEFSEENLEFWIAVEEFKLVKPRKVSSMAHKIYSNFVEEQAPREINVDSETRLRTLAKLTTPSKSVFEEAQRKVQALMEKDSYPRFLESDVYQRVVRSSKC